jgi:(2R)-ethylmalonyl-CoA mutase
LQLDADGGVFRVAQQAADEALGALAETRRRRDPGKVRETLAQLQRDARSGNKLMEASIACALARVTTGEWAATLRGVFGEYRPATGVEGQRLGLETDAVTRLRERIGALTTRLGRRPRLVVGKPGLDGHSNGAEVVAVSARHVGFDVVYAGIRLSPDEIVQSAVAESADVIGASVLSGSHLELAARIMEGLDRAGARDRIQVVMGGIIPAADIAALRALGVERIFTPADFGPIEIMAEIVGLIEERAGR